MYMCIDCTLKHVWDYNIQGPVGYHTAPEWSHFFFTFQLMMMVANYISSLEADKLKLRAQVKRLCAENNWLRESLTESQQLLQQAEVSLEKLKVDKEHLEFIQSQSGVSQRMSAGHYMEQDDHGSEIISTKEGGCGCVGHRSVIN